MESQDVLNASPWTMVTLKSIINNNINIMDAKGVLDKTTTESTKMLNIYLSPTSKALIKLLQRRMRDMEAET